MPLGVVAWFRKGIGGQLTSISSYVMKHPPVQVTDDEAYENVENLFLAI